MSPAGGIWAPIAMRAFKHAFKKASNLVRNRLTELSRPLVQGELEPVLVRSTPKQPIHPAARIRQLKSGRWYTTHSTINAAVRRFMSSAAVDAIKYNRAAFPKSATATAVARLTTRAPFSSTLRPNLTAGCFPRTAGGYSLGGRTTARYFSHTPAAPAQVINNVSTAVRAFWLSGQKAQFNGMTPTGEKSYRNITNLQEQTGRKMQAISKNSPGSFIDFSLNPTVTALTPLGATFGFGSTTERSTPTLNSEGFLDVLSVDFSRALKDLAATLNDLKRLSTLGDLPITLENKHILRIRFPGCDAETVERLCDEVGVQRGIIYQDEEFEIPGTKMALMFPFAPTSEHTLSSPGGSLHSQSGHYFEEIEDVVDNPWLDGYESASEGESVYFTKPSEHQNSSDYEGLEGIYRFLEQCDNAQRIQ
ncbi:uncharacterized protein LY89DRAFT_600397 [Mollisia scopiformis]|uniref:Casein kinase II beta 2 subunit n=1 Tax=Mollisia scopiformis TaxID=149040 RepID=A0A132B6B3_MOLSC|nr:uncharacterized protein LY89DRAFT_600397 [Mollisia scopiformis]KUJ07945.1 hypothetical protein LY89DRAFT_600397 [Mollisia scopiformis]